MQVFRPYVDHAASARFLDDKRLGKQRIETKQVLLAILRRSGVLNDGRKGWINHPIVLLYFNNGKPYIDDLVGYFYAVIDEWERRGFRNNIVLNDIEPLLGRLESSSGTPVTPTMAREYRRVLLLKEPCHYLSKLSRSELEELLSTEPMYINGINTWILQVMDEYREFMRKLGEGQITCRGLFPRRSFRPSIITDQD